MIMTYHLMIMGKLWWLFEYYVLNICWILGSPSDHLFIFIHIYSYRDYSLFIHIEIIRCSTAYYLITRLPRVEYLLIIWLSPEDDLMIIWWSFDDHLLIFSWLSYYPIIIGWSSADHVMIIKRSYEDYLMIICSLSDYLMIVW